MGARFSNGVSNGGAQRVGPVSDINVTPLVDVMLVLLIVFMVAAPMMASGVKVDLPTANTRPLQEPKPPIVISMDQAGTVYVNQDAAGPGQLLALVAKEAGGDLERRIHLRADQTLAYGRVVSTMGLLNDAGYARIALVSEAPQH
ncbi:ExbD/TolR family protein [Janthinobacterium agaricidamnosum]|uniref:Biopolymer transport ExbD/TolR family protein n=1 Tax=Janthinobacterium agaricidamnosum NBRC 102515 = DSM 9628 TaxID=1349767 RepID=W0V4T0_9BURK|nr:ExbD/TolR family protein [Janthinobacterium agaricidamnosum]CDG82358.1 biopolymer transport ExbD/TolR family protein [Janthinobacterium agaricidamnosum NBRC 102515 = DSM 9628]